MTIILAQVLRGFGYFLCMFVSGGGGGWGVDGVGYPCPPVRNDIVTSRHLFSFTTFSSGSVRYIDNHVLEGLRFTTLTLLACSVHGLAHSLGSLHHETVEILDNVFTRHTEINAIKVTRITP